MAWSVNRSGGTCRASVSTPNPQALRDLVSPERLPSSSFQTLCSTSARFVKRLILISPWTSYVSSKKSTSWQAWDESPVEKARDSVHLPLFCSFTGREDASGFQLDFPLTCVIISLYFCFNQWRRFMKLDTSLWDLYLHKTPGKLF